jgi:hypothetical protein
MKEDVETGMDFKRIGGYLNRSTWVGYNLLCSVSISYLFSVQCPF